MRRPKRLWCWLRNYDPELWRMPDDRIWALKECAKPEGMMPHAESTAKFLKTMELEGLVRQSDRAPVWYITDSGRSALRAYYDSVINDVDEAAMTALLAESFSFWR